MRKCFLLIGLTAILVCLSGCNWIKGNVTVTLLEYNSAPAGLAREYGIDVAIRDSEGNIVATFRCDKNSIYGANGAKWELKLPVGDYVAAATCPLRGTVTTAFHVGLGDPVTAVLRFNTLITRGRVTYEGWIPPAEWRGDIVVKMWAFSDRDGHDPEVIAETGVDDQGGFVFVVPPERWMNPIAYVEVNGVLHLSVGWLTMFGISEEMAPLNYGTFE